MSTATEAKTYNGWANYETWAVKLWMDNDQGSQEHVFEMARDARENAERNSVLTGVEAARVALADSLKEMVEEDSPLAEDASMYADLLGAAIGEVDWHEIAVALLEDTEDE